MGSVRRNMAQNNVVFETILQDLERLMLSETVINQNPWPIVCPRFGLGVEYTFKPLQADLRVCISRFGARIMLARGGICGPVTSMGYSWPDDH
jgi:hypothetical protein